MFCDLTIAKTKKTWPKPLRWSSHFWIYLPKFVNLLVLVKYAWKIKTITVVANWQMNIWIFKSITYMCGKLRLSLSLPTWKWIFLLWNMKYHYHFQLFLFLFLFLYCWTSCNVKRESNKTNGYYTTKVEPITIRSMGPSILNGTYCANIFMNCRIIFMNYQGDKRLNI